jgi:hypothetical protein
VIESLIENLVNEPSKKNESEYLDFVHLMEISLLQDAEQFPYKSWEYFNKRREAFSYRRESSVKLLTSWVEKYKTTQGCIVSYRDTLNIPFNTITPPK